MTAYYNEIDRFAAEWLRQLISAGHIAPGDVDERSIEDVKPDDLRPYSQCHFFAGIGIWSYALRLAGWDDSRPVWTGSCPCQPFSAAGKAAGFDDERHLWPAWFHLIAHAKPRGVPVFGEQVASKDGLAWLDLVHADMEGAGYSVRALDFCAAGVGAPHIRQRLYFVADSSSKRHDRRGSGQEGPESGTKQQFERFRDAFILADTEGRGQRELRSAQGQAGQSDIGDGVGLLGHAVRAGLEGLCGNGDNGDKPGRDRAPPSRYAPEAGATRGMADTDNPERWTDYTGRNNADGQAPGWNESHGDPTECCRVIELANADGGDAGPEELQRGGEHGQRSEDCRTVWSGYSRIWHNSGGASDRPGPTNGHWRDVDWLFCRDGKWRPVEPGTFPLVNGAPARMGRLRGFGNGIVAEAAKAFIEAYDGVAP